MKGCPDGIIVVYPFVQLDYHGLTDDYSNPLVILPVGLEAEQVFLCTKKNDHSMPYRITLFQTQTVNVYPWKRRRSLMLPSPAERQARLWPCCNAKDHQRSKKIPPAWLLPS